MQLSKIHRILQCGINKKFGNPTNSTLVNRSTFLTINRIYFQDQIQNVMQCLYQYIKSNSISCSQNFDNSILTKTCQYFNSTRGVEKSLHTIYKICFPSKRDSHKLSLHIWGLDEFISSFIFLFALMRKISIYWNILLVELFSFHVE